MKLKKLKMYTLNKKSFGGKAHIEKACKEMDEVQKILELEGVVVKRPEVIDWSKPIKTPWFEAQGKI